MTPTPNANLYQPAAGTPRCSGNTFVAKNTVARGAKSYAFNLSVNRIERVAQAMIRRHGAGAARAATERLNDMIDRGDALRCELWACVVHAIHDR